MLHSGRYRPDIVDRHPDLPHGLESSCREEFRQPDVMHFKGRCRNDTIYRMVAQNIIDTVLSLPVNDQLDLFERLRIQLLDGRTVLNEEQRRALLDQRLSEFESDPEEGLPWEQVEAEILAKLDRS